MQRGKDRLAWAASNPSLVVFENDFKHNLRLRSDAPFTVVHQLQVPAICAELKTVLPDAIPSPVGCGVKFQVGVNAEKLRSYCQLLCSDFLN